MSDSKWKCKITAMATRRPVFASLLVLFLPASGICGWLSPLQDSESFCSAKAAPVESSRCPMEENAPESCPLSSDKPIAPGCHSCDLVATLSSKEEGPTTNAAPVRGVEAGNDRAVRLSPALRTVSLRLAVLAAAPRLNLLHETFRN